MEQVLVPQQDKGESCGYRMLSNLNKVIKGQGIQGGREERNRLYYYLEIAQTLKDNQVKRHQRRKQKRKRKEEEEEEEGEEEEVEQEEIEKEQKQQTKRSKQNESKKTKKNEPGK